MSFLLIAFWLQCQPNSDATSPLPAKQHGVLTPDSGKVTGDMVITQTPITISIPLNNSLQRAIEDALSSEEKTIRLLVKNLIPPSESGVTGFAVFVEKPDATAATSSEDKHYVDARAFGPRVTNAHPR